jgi:hypothetical protein
MTTATESPLDTGQVRWSHPDRVDDPHVREVAALAQLVHRGGANAELLGHLGDLEEAVAAAVEYEQVLQSRGSCARTGRSGVVPRRPRLRPGRPLGVG